MRSALGDQIGATDEVIVMLKDKKTTFQDGDPSQRTKDLDIRLKSYRYQLNKSTILRDKRNAYVGYFNLYHVLMRWAQTDCSLRTIRY